MKKKKNKYGGSGVYLLKWISLIAGCLIFAGVLSFALILLCVDAIEGGLTLNPIWIVGMIPLMTLFAVPVTFIVYKQVSKNIIVLIDGMEKVAGGDLDAYIPTAYEKDFAEVYENFNKMVAEIQSLENLRSVMFDNLSHELKTPIASISGFAKLLNEKDLPEGKRNKYLQIIASESERLEKLVNNTLLLSKLDAQEIVHNKDEFSLSRQIQDCVISLEREWSGKDIVITADLADVFFKGDFELVKSIWLNLLGNAIKFTPRGGEINIAMAENESDVSVTVSDTGIGMTEEVAGHIFERHYRANKDLSKGQGLGLAIVKRAVKLCGGGITVLSKENEGSAFTVSLPKNSRNS